MAPKTVDAVTKSSDKTADDESSIRSRLLIKNGETQEYNNNVISNARRLNDNQNPDLIDENIPFTPKIRWPDLLAQVFIHGGSVYGLYYLITLKAAFYTYVWCR